MGKAHIGFEGTVDELKCNDDVREKISGIPEKAFFGRNYFYAPRRKSAGF